jgi:hypothetical protein
MSQPLPDEQIERRDEIPDEERLPGEEDEERALRLAEEAERNEDEAGEG